MSKLVLSEICTLKLENWIKNFNDFLTFSEYSNVKYLSF